LDIWKFTKLVLALGFICGWVTLAFISTAFVASIPLLPVIGAMFDVVIAPIWITAGIFALPISVAISLKLLSWIDSGLGEFRIKLNLRGKFVRLRSSLLRHFPKIVNDTVTLLT